jgi:nucleotide-binding universal stress UspA family protein
MSDREDPPRSVYIWVSEGTWRSAVDAALSLAPPGSRFTLLHVTSEEVPDAARGAYAGLLGRGGRDPATRLAEEAAASGTRLLQAAAARLKQGIGRDCDRLGLQGRTERVVVAASAQADLLIVARDGDQARLGPKSLGRATRFVVDHAACPVLLVWPGTAPGIASIPPLPPPPPTHPPSPPPPTRPPSPPHHPSPPGR